MSPERELDAVRSELRPRAPERKKPPHPAGAAYARRGTATRRMVSTRGRTPVPVPADRKDTAAISPLRRAHGVRLRRGRRSARSAQGCPPKLWYAKAPSRGGQSMEAERSLPAWPAAEPRWKTSCPRLRRMQKYKSRKSLSCDFPLSCDSYFFLTSNSLRLYRSTNALFVW